MAMRAAESWSAPALSTPPVVGPRLTFASLHPRDRTIIALATGQLSREHPSWEECVTALRAAVEDTIEGGRVYALHAADGAVVIGSLISRVGITVVAGRVWLVRVGLDGAIERVSPFRR